MHCIYITAGQVKVKQMTFFKFLERLVCWRIILYFNLCICVFVFVYLYLGGLFVFETVV